MSKCKIYDKGAKTDLVLLHGFNSKKEHMLMMKNQYSDLNVNIIACDVNGHGDDKKSSSKCHWKKSSNELIDLLKKRNNEVVLIGNSMGSAESICIAETLPKVKQVFAIVSPHDASFGLTSVNFSNELIDLCRFDFEEISSILPINHKKNKNTEYYFIHNKGDKLIPFTHFEANVQKFQPKDTLVYNNTSKMFFFHIQPYYMNQTHDFIKNHLKL